MDSEAAVQRKIELQSPEDLSYLIANVRRAAQGHLNDAFPLMEGSEDDVLRTQIEKHINDVRSPAFATPFRDILHVSEPY